MRPAIVVASLCACLFPACESSQNVGRFSAMLCSAQMPCPSGQFCFNGLCTIGCNGNQDCGPGQYCDTEFDRLCRSTTVATCPETPCADSQKCAAGLCSTSTETQCTPSIDGNDGCDASALCFEEQGSTEKRCHTFPACPETGECPVGLIGSVCNRGQIPNKAHICLTGMCASAANCPTGFKCLRPFGLPLGLCSAGLLSWPCFASGDCADGLACTGAMGIPGICLVSAGSECVDAGGTCVTGYGGTCPQGTQRNLQLDCASLTEECCTPT
jgi:hypothetical protein